MMKIAGDQLKSAPSLNIAACKSHTNTKTKPVSKSWWRGRAAEGCFCKISNHNPSSAQSMRRSRVIRLVHFRQIHISTESLPDANEGII